MDHPQQFALSSLSEAACPSLSEAPRPAAALRPAFGGAGLSLANL